MGMWYKARAHLQISNPVHCVRNGQTSQAMLSWWQIMTFMHYSATSPRDVISASDKGPTQQHPQPTDARRRNKERQYCISCTTTHATADEKRQLSCTTMHTRIIVRHCLTGRITVCSGIDATCRWLRSRVDVKVKNFNSTLLNPVNGENRVDT